MQAQPTFWTRTTPYVSGVVFFGLVALAPFITQDAYFLDTLILILLWGALAGAWNVAGGYAGQVSLGHAAFFGLGAYCAVLLTVFWDFSPWIGMLLGATLSTIAGLVIGYLSNRLRGPYFALATIAFAQMLLIVFSRWRAVTMGSEGLPVPFRIGLINFGFTTKLPWLFLALGFALLVYGVSIFLEVSRLGYQLAGVREDEDAAQALGINTRRLKVIAIVLSAFLTSICGTFWAQYIGFVDPFYVFSLDLSVRFALMAIIGGTGTAIGPFFGSLLITALESYLRATLSGIQSGFTGIYLIIYGVLLIIVVRFLPQGVSVWLAQLLRRRGKKRVTVEA